MEELTNVMILNVEKMQNEIRYNKIRMNSVTGMLIVIFLFSSGLIHAQSGCGANIVLLGDNAAQATDSVLREHITNDLGFNFDYKGSEEALPEDILAGGYNLVIISNSLSSSTAETYVDLPVPIINLEGWALDGLNMVKAWDDSDIKAYNNMPYQNDNENSFTSLVVNAGDSVRSIGLDAGYAGDTIPVFTADVPYQNNQHPAYLAIPNENAYPILEYREDAMIWLAENEPDICGADYCLEEKRYAAFVYEKGAEMEYEFLAPEKRGFFFFHTHTAAVVTSQVWEIFDAMVYWGLGCLERPENPGTYNNSAALSLDVRLYPNPSNGNIKIHLLQTKNDAYRMSVYNLQGKRIFQRSIDGGNENSIDLPVDNPGTYLLRIVRESDGAGITEKIIIRN